MFLRVVQRALFSAPFLPSRSDGYTIVDFFSKRSFTVCVKRFGGCNEFVVTICHFDRKPTSMKPCSLIGTRRDVGLVQLLVESSANMNVQNNESRTPLEEALVKGHLDVVQLLWNQATFKSRDNWPLAVRPKHLSESDDVVECTLIQREDAPPTRCCFVQESSSIKIETEAQRIQ